MDPFNTMNVFTSMHWINIRHNSNSWFEFGSVSCKKFSRCWKTASSLKWFKTKLSYLCVHLADFSMCQSRPNILNSISFLKKLIKGSSWVYCLLNDSSLRNCQLDPLVLNIYFLKFSENRTLSYNLIIS